MDAIRILVQWLTATIDWRWMVGVALRVTVVVAVGQSLLALMPRASASLRHLIAVTSLAAALLIPLSTPLLPAWRLPLLPAPVGAPPSAGPAAPTPAGAASPTRSHSGSLIAQDTPARRLGAASSSSLAHVREMPAGAAWTATSWASAVAALVALVAFLLLARIGALLAFAQWVYARAQSIEHPHVIEEFERARQELGLRSSVGVRASARVRVPAVTGIVAGRLLLPIGAPEWDRQRLRAVFLHELAHVQRCDSIAMLIVRSAEALFWFHPLVILLARSAQRDCERACDDVVLSRGVRASEYARHLLEIAGRARGAGFMGLTLAFARPSSFESRLLAILRNDRARGRLSGRAVAGAGIAALLLTLPLAAARVVASPARPWRVATNSAAPRTSTAVETHTSSSIALGEVTRTLETGVPAPDPADRSLANGLPPAQQPLKDEDLYGRAKKLYEQERYGDAGEVYERAAAAGIRTGSAYYNAACSFALDGQKNRALGDLVSALEAGFDQTDMLQTDSDLNSIRSDRRFQLILKGQAGTDRNLEKLNDASSEYSSLKAENSTDAVAWKSVGISLMRSGDSRLAADAFARQFAVDSSASAHYNQACALALGGRTTQALDALECALAGGYDDPGHIPEDADLISLHDSPRFDQLVEIAEDLNLHGEGYGDWENVDSWREALPRYQRIAEKHPGFGRAWFNLGFAQLRARDPRASRASFLRALDHGYRVGPTCYNVACASAQLGESDTAFAWLNRAAELGYDVSSTARNDKDLDPLRSDARFRALIESDDHRVASKKGSGHKKS